MDGGNIEGSAGNPWRVCIVGRSRPWNTQTNEVSVSVSVNSGPLLFYTVLRQALSKPESH